MVFNLERIVRITYVRLQQIKNSVPAKLRLERIKAELMANIYSVYILFSEQIKILYKQSSNSLYTQLRLWLETLFLKAECK